MEELMHRIEIIRRWRDRWSEVSGNECINAMGNPNHYEDVNALLAYSDFLKSELDECFRYEAFLYDALGPAADDVIDLYDEGGN